MNTILEIFNDECKHVVIDSHLIKKLKKYQSDFVLKNTDHQEFFGGNLTGVQVVRFTNSDRNRWFDEILEVDDGPLEERLIVLPGVNKEFHVSSDTMNLSCIWLTHAIYSSPKLTTQQKHDGMLTTILILQYKYITSLIFHYFRYPADKATAEATYAQLNYKYSIKVYGSWSALLEARADEIISESSIHYRTIREMNNNDDVTYMLNDTQGRIRDILKNIYSVFRQVHDQGVRIVTTSSVIEHEGVEVLKEKLSNQSTYNRYLHSIITDKNSFIKSELTSIIEKLIHTMPSKLFIESLEWISGNYRQHGAGVIEEVLNETLIHCFDYINNNKDVIRSNTDYATLLTKLKGVYMSSRSTDEALFSLRSKTEKIVKMAITNKNDSVISSIRTGLLLYIVLRTLVKKHYEY